ncbi:hypothetical protein UFOVP71_174 [uncultured Caudovirales phage]|uniref:Uncharacterized protein n=1 Tax=uncultured Caudovirales phage TaxID=2100421 RepID=A0A6J5T9Q9_9CAUD|nr:hypothetical protein UFOVP71_174 [uncultured Caudovirales phage]
MKGFWFLFLTGLALFLTAAFGIALEGHGNIIDHMLVIMLGLGLMFCSSLMLEIRK